LFAVSFLMMASSKKTNALYGCGCIDSHLIVADKQAYTRHQMKE
jgi:hypothetical protein